MRGRLRPLVPRPPPRGKTPARAGTTTRTHAGWPRTPEDPRACGDDFSLAHRAGSQAGRSPRVRGRPPPHPPRPLPAGKIPARAGTTRRLISTPRSWREDPRACGDDDHRPDEVAPLPGRSPRVRGRLALTRAGLIARGKIPARAGTTATTLASHPPNSEDPRACGDDGRGPAVVTRAAGRSPRVRGRRGSLASPAARWGKIPARAGRTPQTPASIGCRAEDPRACGEDIGIGLGELPVQGRSPRVRGGPRVGGGGRPVRGKIPARAGRTHRASRRQSSRGEDPRACGEDAQGVASPVLAWGRSPRVRGGPGRGPARPAAPGKIPARAGRTPAVPPRPRRPREDPRACGEDPSSPSPSSPTEGRSPRVRGGLPPGGAVPGCSGKIPARAGRTHPRCGTLGFVGEDPRACGEDSC